jgi:hypothetical protein
VQQQRPTPRHNILTLSPSFRVFLPLPSSFSSAGHAPDAASEAALARPLVLPPAPYFLASHLVNVTCPVEALESHIRGSLASSGVDYEYSPAKYKARCYQYKAGAALYFVLKAFTHVSPAGGESYLIELQRQCGCPSLFRSVFARVVEDLRSRGIVRAADEEVLARVSGAVPAVLMEQTQQAQKDKECAASPTGAGAATATTGTQPAVAASPSPGPQSPPAPIALPRGLVDSEVDPDDDPVLARIFGSGSPGANQPTSAEEESASVAAFSALSSMLASDFDDVACPAAHSISAMTVSRRIRAAIGKKAVVGIEAWRALATAATGGARALPPHLAASVVVAARTGVQMPSPPPGLPVPLTPPGAATVALPGNSDGSVPVAQMIERLISRACTPSFHPGMHPSVPRASIESRTACAIALANLSADPDAAGALASLHLAPRLLYAVHVVPHCASSAAFRRECLRAVHGALSADPASRRSALTQFCLESARLIPGFHDPKVGDAVLDRWCAGIEELLVRERETLANGH